MEDAIANDIHPKPPGPLLGPMRLPFLVLTPACVLLGVATAQWAGPAINWGYAALALLGAVAAHVAVNALNEHHDFGSGLDARTRRTPFSGGSGALQAAPAAARIALVTGLTALAVVAVVGGIFIWIRGWALLPIGLLGVLVVVTYTGWLTRQPLLCLVAPGLGFGPLMVMGTHFALTGTYSVTAAIASLVPFFLVSDLLLLNQFPDVEADRSVGRHHLPIAIGRRASVWIYALFLMGAYLAIIVGLLLGWLPPWGLLALATLLLAVPTVLGAARFAEDIPRLVPYLGKNVVINLATPVLLATGLLIG